MRPRLFRAAGLMIGLLGVPSVAFQAWKDWPPGGLMAEFLILQALVVGMFLAYGTGLAYQTPAGGLPQPAGAGRHP